MKTIMIVGAGFGQVPAIQTAKSMGLRVVALDRNPNAIGMALADVALPVDVADAEGAIAAARKYAVNGVITMQTDLPIPTVGAVVDALDLPGCGLEIARRCSEKDRTRKAFESQNVMQPAYRIVHTVAEALTGAREIGFPCIVKSSDSSGSRGVVRANGEDAMEAAFNEAWHYSRNHNLLVEEFIEGIELGAQTFSWKGKCRKVLLHNDTVSLPPYMIPVGHSFPCRLPEAQAREVEDMIACGVEALGISDGPANIDLILDRQGRVRMLEVGARIGATCLPELVKYFTGIDWVALAIRCALGESPDLTATRADPVAALILEAPADGVLRDYQIPDKALQEPGLMELEVTARPGETVSRLRKGPDRIGKIVAMADTVDDAEARCLRIRDQIVFHVE